MTHPEVIIKQHIDLCEEVYRVLQEENRILRTTGKAPEEAFLEKKRQLLPLLDNSVQALKLVREGSQPTGQRTRDLVSQGQRIMMKIFLLDRENEQLLLKISANPTLALTRSPQNLQPYRPSPPSVKNAYQRHGRMS